MSFIPKYPNQYSIIVNKCPEDKRNAGVSLIIDKNQFYNMINQCRQEGGLSALALWGFLMSNNHNYKINYSPQHFMNCTGYSRSATFKAMDFLKDNNYIIEEKPGVFKVYGWPQTFTQMSFDELIKLDKEDMEEFYYQIQNELNWDNLSEDVHKFYEFYQKFYEE